ncbi:MAG: ATP-binding protein [Thermodesulfobacteriota bacterium]
MKNIHSLLRRQLKKQFGSPESPDRELEEFLSMINDAYWEFDSDREMLERSLDLSSQELAKANESLQAETQERKRTEEALKENLAQVEKKSRYETIINLVTTSIHQSIDLQEVLENAVDVMSRNIEGVDNISIYLVEEQDAVMKAYRGLPDWFVERVASIPHPKGFTWKTILDGKPRYVADADKDTVIGPAGKELGTKSYLSMPIEFEERVIGCINVNSMELNAFDQEELTLLEIVAKQIEVAYKNAQQAAELTKTNALLKKEIAERKQAEEALKENLERYVILTENPFILISESTSLGHFAYLSPNHKDILGYEPEELVGRNILEHVHPDDLAGANSSFQMAMSTLGVGRGEFRYRHKNGQWRWLEAQGKGYRTARGEIRGILISRDITDRKRAEEELIKSQKLESIGALAGGIAHDFNNLLTGIMGNISITKMLVNEEAKSYKRLVEAENACLKAKTLTGQLLTFSKGGSPVKKIIRLEDLIRDWTEFVLRGSNVKAYYTLSKDLWRVNADEGQMSQVIQNLTMNANEAMPKGGKVRITARNVEIEQGSVIPLSAGNYIVIEIEDTGIGIREDYLLKIFDPYFTTKEKGSGLGLTTVYSIINNHEGYITVESKIGVGTKFLIFLPAAGIEAQSKDIDELELLRGKGKILVMDDEETVREVVREIIEYLGYEPDLAKDGSEATQMYHAAINNASPYDAVILDLTVPGGIGGLETIEFILEVDPDAKVIVSSGYSNDPVMSNFEDHGFKGVITKPYNIGDVAKTLHEILSKEE